MIATTQTISAAVGDSTRSANSSMSVMAGVKALSIWHVPTVRYTYEALPNASVSAASAPTGHALV